MTTGRQILIARQSNIKPANMALYAHGVESNVLVFVIVSPRKGDAALRAESGGFMNSPG